MGVALKKREEEQLTLHDFFARSSQMPHTFGSSFYLEPKCHGKTLRDSFMCTLNSVFFLGFLFFGKFLRDMELTQVCVVVTASMAGV